MISVIYPHSSVGTGLGGYSSRLIKGLREINISLEELPVQKREYTILGKPMFGNISLKMGTSFLRPKGKVVHSLSPEVIHPKTNVVTVHDLIPLKMPEVFSNTYYRERGTKLVFGKLSQISQLIVFTQAGKRELMELAGVSEDRIDIVPQSVDHGIFYPDPDEKLQLPGKKLILTVGDLNPRKRFDLIFNALGGLEDYNVVHIGPVNAWESKKKELEEIAKKFDNIKMIGEADQGTLRKFMSSADLLIHISHAEGFGSTPVEAMACGTNVLVNDLEIFKETLNDNAFFTSIDESQIAKQTEFALEHKKSSQELIEHSQKFSIRNMAENTVKVYEKISSENG